MRKTQPNPVKKTLQTPPEQGERRRKPRVRVDLPLRLTVRDRTVETHIRDLSVTGIRFRAPEALPLMSRVQIGLELPEIKAQGASSIAITGVVVRCNEETLGRLPFDVAIYFEDLSERSRARLGHFVDSRLAED